MKASGDRIGKYVIERLLGSGANGSVYLATDEMLGRHVALKLLHPQLMHDLGIAGRFRQEASAMARLNHANVVVVFDFVTDAGEWAIVMEYVEGSQSLATVLARERVLDPARALDIARQVAAGLGHAHARGIVHRDVKPANVLVVRDGEEEIAKVTDFGIARILDGERRTGRDMTLGTIYYLAPEQAQNSSVDARADVYSLGVTLYELLTGKVPFPYDTAARVLAAHVAEKPAPPSSRVPAIPPAIDALLLRVLSKKPEERPASGASLVAEIERLEDELARTGRVIPKTRLMKAAQLDLGGTVGSDPLAPTMATSVAPLGRGDQTPVLTPAPRHFNPPTPTPAPTPRLIGPPTPVPAGTPVTRRPPPLGPPPREGSAMMTGVWITLIVFGVVVLACFLGSVVLAAMNCTSGGY